MTPMGRELPANPYVVRDVPPLPLPVLPEPYGMRFASPYADAEMICEWMNRPHLAGTWNDDNSLTWWRRNLSSQIEGWYSRPYIASFEGQDFVYLELFRAAQDVLGTAYEADPHDVGVHGAIADPEMIKKGHGAIVFRHTVAGVLSAEPQCRRVMGDIPVGGAVRRFKEQVGGVWIGEAHMANWDQPRALFTWPRSPEDIPRLRETQAPESNPGT